MCLKRIFHPYIPTKLMNSTINDQRMTSATRAIYLKNSKAIPGLIGCCLIFSNIHADAVILYGAGNDANLTPPASGAPFDAVARVQSSPGAQNGGSGVHLGGGYMLTAAHIANTEIASVTFDSVNFYSRDLSFSPVQIGGTADMKIFRLSSVPTVGSAAIYTGTSEMSHGGTLIGWGRGRVEGSALNTNTVPLADGGTPLVKRWGTNDPTRTIDDFSILSFTFDAIETVLGNVGGNPNNNGTGDFEAAATPRDSGAGYFQQIDGNWYLTGIATFIIQQNTDNATYGNDVAWSGNSNGTLSAPVGTGDPNFYVRVSSYADEILMVIPEPSSALLAWLALSGLIMRRRRGAI